jgi:hypothetical protein
MKSKVSDVLFQINIHLTFVMVWTALYFCRVFPPLFATMVDPYFDSLKNADAAEPRFKAWNELDPAGAPIAQHESIMVLVIIICSYIDRFGFPFFIALKYTLLIDLLINCIFRVP